MTLQDSQPLFVPKISSPGPLCHASHPHSPASSAAPSPSPAFAECLASIGLVAQGDSSPRRFGDTAATGGSPRGSEHGWNGLSRSGQLHLFEPEPAPRDALLGLPPEYEYFADTDPPSTITAAAGGTRVLAPLHLAPAPAKRHAEEEAPGGAGLASQSTQSPSKKARFEASSRLHLRTQVNNTQAENAWLNKARENYHDGTDVLSPLFFSHSPRPSASRQSSLAPLETRMSGVQETAEGTTTLRLPKGQVSASSPARSCSTTGSWGSPADAVTALRSPEGRSFLSPILQLIQGIGLVEFLEQDDRPTFIIDMNNITNFQAGPLHIVFANSALRLSQSVQELLQADTNDAAHSPEFSRFKSWVVSLLKSNDAGDVYPSSMSYGGLSWTCSTLRRRFRVVSANVTAMSITPTSPSAPSVIADGTLCVVDQRVMSSRPSRDPETPRERPISVADYFNGELDDGDLNTPVLHLRAQSEPRSKPESLFDMPLVANDDLSLLPPNTNEVRDDVRTTFDWTRIPLDTPNLTEHIRFARSVDWASTPLGPVDSWPADLRSMSNMIMGSPHPAAMYWGREYTAIYNEAYITVAGQKHPRLMGMSYRDAWPEIWHEIEPFFSNAWSCGQAIMKHDDRLFVTRNGFLEESFFNWSVVPLVGSDGSVVAVYNPAFDNTRRRLSERRMHTLRELGEQTSEARDVKSFWGYVQKGLEYNEFDVPFALIYSVCEEGESDGASMHSASVSNPPHIMLEGSLGVPAGHPVAIPNIDLRSSDVGFAPYMRESMARAGTPIVLDRTDGSLPGRLIEGLAWRGFGDPCRTIVVFTVHPTTACDMVVGFMVVGVNPRRPYDDEYKLFVNLLSRQLATSLASVVLFEEEIKRGQRAARLAALDRQELSLQLRIRTQQAVESEYRFSRMAAFGPVGMFITDGEGRITYCNDMWWKISGHERTTKTVDNVTWQQQSIERATKTIDGWMQSVRDEDRLGVEAAWRSLVNDKVAVTHEFRFRGSRQVIDGHSVDTWVLMSAYPQQDEAGELKSIFGCLTDISQQKWAEAVQKQRREEAVEMKRQQENFIDITSHEMRNPLSAILQCADEIVSTISDYRQGSSSWSSSTSSASSPTRTQMLPMLLDSCVEAASTISLCASHQKRIVDDVLTLSKLDSQLLLVTPVDVQPVEVVANVLRMFDPELTSNSIGFEFIIEPSYVELGIDWVKMDPSRMRQVLINLMTNAIKFTQGRDKRSIVVKLGAIRHGSQLPPPYFPMRTPTNRAKKDADHLIEDSRAAGADVTDRPVWGDGEKVNVHISVTDTGPGLDDDEKKILFKRFAQTTPRTHVQYGGSGLGLFICRMLTELQGGQIGVESEKGVGSTFAFYVKARKVAGVPNPDPAATVLTPSSSPAKAPPNGLASPSLKAMSYSSPLVGDDAQRQQLAPPSPLSNPPRPVSARCQHQHFDVLIVEDNLVNQKVLQRQLRNWGNNTVVANHGGEALEALSRSRYWSREMSPFSMPPTTPTSLVVANGAAAEVANGAAGNFNISVILMDLEMPVMDGMTCARKIRQLEANGTIVRHIPIIAVTAYARPEQIKDAMDAGIDDVISKPFRIPELIPKIEELVAKFNTSSWTSTESSVEELND